MILALAAAERNTKSVAGAINRNCKTEYRRQHTGERSQTRKGARSKVKGQRELRTYDAMIQRLYDSMTV